MSNVVPHPAAMPTRHFPNWLKAYMDYTSDSEAPTAFNFWTGVSVVAGALRRRVWIDMRAFQWTPNFYIILVGPAGVVTKSTTSRRGMGLLRQIDGIHFGPQSMTWQALGLALEEAIQHIEHFDSQRGETLHLPMSCLTIEVSELGTLFRMDDDQLVSVLIDMWDGQKGPWKHRTVASSQIEIQNPWINLIGCTTPAWLRQNFPEHMIGGGLTSRTIFVYGDRKRRYIAFPDEVHAGPEYYELERKLVEDLRQIAELQGEFTVTAEAREWGRPYYEEVLKYRPAHMASARYDGYISRRQTHMFKVAMVLSSAKRGDLRITREDLQEADELLSTVEPSMIKVFESIGVVDEAKHINELVPIVKAHGWLTSQELWSLVMNVMSQKDFKAAVSAAVEGGVFLVENRDGKLGVKAAQ